MASRQTPREGGDVSLGELLKQLGTDTGRLIRGEIALARKETKDALQQLRTAAVLVASGAVLSLLALGTLTAAAVLGPRAAGVVASLQRDSANVAEAAQAVQGYYEEMTGAHVPTGSFLALLERRPTPAPNTGYAEMTRPADALLVHELIPGWSGEVRGSRLAFNGFGMRDRPERSQAKPASTCRVAVVGSSVVMGYGVGDVKALIDGTLKQPRLLAGAPRVIGAGELDWILRDAMQYW